MDGRKKVELRRMRPAIQRDDLLLFYVSSPRKELFACSIVESIHLSSPDIIWKETKDAAAISRCDFERYFHGATQAVGIRFGPVQIFRPVIPLSRLRIIWPGFHPPQSFRYVSPNEYALLLELSNQVIASDLQSPLLKISVASYR